MRQRRSNGFTLIEVIVALFLLGLVLVIFQVAGQSIPLVRSSKNEGVALDSVRGELESLRTLGYGNLPVSGPYSDSMISTLPSGSGSIAVSNFNASTKEVVVTVTWTELNAATSSTVSLTTLVTQTGGL